MSVKFSIAIENFTKKIFSQPSPTGRTFSQWWQNSLICQFANFQFSQLNTLVRVTNLEEMATLDLGFPVRLNRYIAAII